MKTNNDINGRPLVDQSEMAARIHAFDWSRTSIGAQETWSPALRMMVRFLLANRFPLLLWWGPEYISIYNDAYRPILGEKHPWALGKPGGKCWAEIWDVLKPLVDAPFTGGPSTWMEDIELCVQRSGFTEETHFTVAYSPVPDETVTGCIGGVLATVHEISGKVISERRVALLRDLGTRSAEAKTAEQACINAAGTLGGHPKDVPFSLIYLLEPDGQSARLAASSGIDGSSDDFSPSIIQLDEENRQADAWPLRVVRDGEKLQVIENLAVRFRMLPSGPWPNAPHTAIVLPVRSNIAHELAGFLIAGVSSRIALDDAYKDFFQVAVGPIATAIANARAYEQERYRAEALAGIDRAKTAFFSNVSHEFRTPLTLMLGPLERLLANSTRFQSEDKEQIEIAHRNSLRLLKLVNTLLDFSRIEAGRLKALYRPVDLSVLTTDLASNFRSAIQSAGLDFTVDCPPLAEPVYVDQEMWEKIVLNLLSNAFKFTFSGSISIRLHAEKDKAVLTVTDSGTGIPETELPHIFERFHRVEGAKGRSFEGSGIGLALIQELTKIHGGSVTAQSRADEGSAFVVCVPLGKSHLPADRISEERTIQPTTLYTQAWLLEEDAHGRTQDSQPTHKNIGIQRVVVADDNADMREHISRILGNVYIVSTAANGEEALNLIEENQPDLLLTDVMMPGIDGFQLLRAVRSNAATRTLPVIFLSARAGEEARIEGIEAGASDYLSKPFTANELRARVSTHMQMARIRKEAETSLRESEARLRFALTAGKFGTWEIDLETMSLTCSAQCKANFGVPKEEMFTYEVLRAAIHPEDRERVAAAIVHVIEIIGDYQAEYRCLWPDGTIHWIGVSGRVVADEKGRPLKMAGVTLDITARKHAELQFETLLNQAPIGVFLIDADFKICQVNPSAISAFGDIPNLIGRGFDETMHLLWPKEYADEVVSIYRHTLDTGESYATPERIEQRLDRGIKEYYEWRIDRIALPDGRFGVVCYFRDISQQVLARLAVERSELALRESEERLRLATDNAEIGFWDVDVLNNTLIWPPRVKAMFGISPDVPVSMLDFYNGLHPDDRVATGEAYAAAADPTRQALYDVEYRTVGKEDGLVRWVAAKGRGLFDEQGKCIRVIGTAIDVSNRKATEARLAESEGRYRALAEQVADGIFIADSHGHYTDANGAAAEMLGYTLDELLCLGIRDVLDPGEFERLPEQFGQLATGEIIQNDWRFRRKDGTIFIGDLVARQFPDGRLQGVVRDVTERRRVEDELRRANSDLEQFAYSASHDLREPIRNVAIYSEILERRYGTVLDSRATEYLRFVTNGAKRMDALVKDLLAYTQCSMADDDASLSDATSALEMALANLATTIADTGAKITHGFLPPVAVPAVQLQQLFQNLVGNAIKYRRDLVVPEVCITAELTGTEWKFAVQDNGIGINPEHKEKVFGIFKRLHNNDKYGGTGIGLAICQKIVERRGGRIWVHSEGECPGTTFYFTLPAKG